MKHISRTSRQAGRSGSRAARCEPLEQRTLLAAPLSVSFDAIDMDAQQASTNIYTSPASPSAATGPLNLVNLVNTSVQIFNKGGEPLLTKRLGKNFAYWRDYPEGAS